MNRTEWEKLFMKKVLLPTVLIGCIPFMICCIIGMSLFINSNNIAGDLLGIKFILFGGLYAAVVVTIGMLAGGLDFINKHGIIPEADK